MSKMLILVLVVGTVSMCFPILYVFWQRKIYLWKAPPISLLLTAVGTLGTYIMYYIENGVWGDGISYFGAVFFIPLVFPLIALIWRIPYGTLMDAAAPAECIMLVIMKVHCIIGDCCIGRILYETDSGKVIRFPSRLAELLAALVLGGILLVLSKKDKYKAIGYPMYLILYGCVRFALNILRDEWVTTDMVLPYGNIWSLVAIAVGGLWIFLVNYTKKRKPAETG